VNCHAHLAATLERGFNEDFGFPNSAHLAVRPGSLLQGSEATLMVTVVALEAIRTGTTTIVENSGGISQHAAALIQILEPQDRSQSGTLLHPSSIVDSPAKIGRGAVVLAGAVVQVDAIVDDHAIVNDNATVEHDCAVGAGAHVSCNACLTGEVRVGKGALIGAGAVVLPRIEIGDFAIVGAGAVVTADVPAYATVVGNPARLICSSKKLLSVATSKTGKECNGAI